MTTEKKFTLFVKDIDPEAHKALKVWAAAHGCTMREAVEKAIWGLVKERK